MSSLFHNPPLKKDTPSVMYPVVTLMLLLLFCHIGMAQVQTGARKADIPTPRQALAVCTVDGMIYVIGGRVSGGDALSTVEAYDPNLDHWVARASMPTPRSNPSAAVVDGRIYAIGGQQGDNALQCVEEYDPATDRWRQRDDMPTARTLFTTSVVDGKIYALGGWQGWANNIHLATMEEYDPITNRWRKREPMLGGPRSSLTSGVVDGRIYALGGMVGSNVLSTVEVYDPVMNQWAMRNDVPMDKGIYGIVSNRAVTSHDSVYAIASGGLVVQYVPEIDWWVSRWFMVGESRASYAVATIDARVYLIGGVHGQETLSTVEVFDLDFRDIETGKKQLTLWADLKVAR